ncbi:GNAT family N-acetyltransferase [Ensifer sp. BR816]|uniref:GNAT family N-acetyltransferase n=1 Tax=Rhizobium sp. (strain BR816) TaxID=1057002 RepID=UPI00036371ED|nr:GNAT family N-acetyltransferase [Ensifer sp. BR816]
MKFLIDTNIVIQLENDGEIQAKFANLLRMAQEHGVQVFVHEVSIEDINRDTNEPRKKATLSKVQKFQQLKGVASPSVDELKDRYGELKKPNDVVDAKLLHAVYRSVADFLITEDDGLHRRAKRAGLAERVMTVADALAWLKQSFEPDTVFLPAVEEVKAHAIEFSDPIFDGLRADYNDFDGWTAKCVNEHRDCWIVKNGEALAAIVIRKNEKRSEANIKKPGKKILKICTFKVSEDHRGQKLGEQLLKQIFWHAQRNRYDVVYLTAKAKQESLIRLLEDYGFEKTNEQSDGDGVFERAIGRGKLDLRTGEDALTVARRNYPRFHDGTAIRKFIVPIWPSYHAKLFPEVEMLPENVSTTQVAIPGNTIRKVYICHSTTRKVRPGDIVFFYMTKRDSKSPRVQSITSIGIVENVRHTDDLNEVRRWTAKRSVFSDEGLRNWVGGTSPLKVIDFLLIGHIVPTLPLKLLMSEGVVRSHSQSISEIPEGRYQRLKPLLNLGFEF